MLENVELEKTKSTWLFYVRDGKKGGEGVSGGGFISSLGGIFRGSGDQRPIIPSEAWDDYVLLHVYSFDKVSTAHIPLCNLSISQSQHERRNATSQVKQV